jgi:uncharacterized membrane protein YqjE
VSTAGADDGAALRERPIGDLLKQASQETSTLVRQEIELAKAELTEKGRHAGVAHGMLAVAALVALLAAGALTACLVLALDEAMPAWLAALLVTVAYLIIAGAVALAGRKRLQQAGPPVPEQTLQTLKEDAPWAKTQTP